MCTQVRCDETHALLAALFVNVSTSQRDQHTKNDKKGGHSFYLILHSVTHVLPITFVATHSDACHGLFQVPLHDLRA